MELKLEVRDKDTGEIVSCGDEREFPWQGAAWIVPPEFADALANFLTRRMADVARDIMRYKARKEDTAA